MSLEIEPTIEAILERLRKLEAAEVPDFNVLDSSLLRFRLPGGYHHSVPWQSGTTLVLSTNTLYAVPYYAAKAETVSEIFLVLTGLSAGNARLGIYRDNGSIKPGVLVADCGTVSTGVTGLRNIAGLNVALEHRTLYWLALVTNAIPTVRAYAMGMWGLLGMESTVLDFMGMYTAAFSYAALPNPYPVAGAPVTTTPLALGVRVS